jgi:hypothetical protein
VSVGQFLGCPLLKLSWVESKFKLPFGMFLMSQKFCQEGTQNVCQDLIPTQRSKWIYRVIRFVLLEGSIVNRWKMFYLKRSSFIIRSDKGYNLYFLSPAFDFLIRLGQAILLTTFS